MPVSDVSNPFKNKNVCNPSSEIEEIFHIIIISPINEITDICENFSNMKNI